MIEAAFFLGRLAVFLVVFWRCSAVGRDLRLGEVASFRRGGGAVGLSHRGSRILGGGLAGVLVLADFTPAESPCPL